jgi:hypothetical protein
MSKIEEALKRYSNGEISVERLAELLDVNFYIVHNALRKGCQPVVPTSMGRLLTDHEIDDIRVQCGLSEADGSEPYYPKKYEHALVKAQAALCQQRVERIFKEIEGLFTRRVAYDRKDYAAMAVPLETVGYFVSLQDWHTFKEKEGN